MSAVQTRPAPSSLLSGHRPAASASSRAGAQAGPASTSAREFLRFRLRSEEYGIDILKVQEIRSYEAPTRIANSPAFLKGVVNLRGVIVPILDLRVKLGCDSAEFGGTTVVIVLNMAGRVVGAVVDAVSDVLQLSTEQVKAAPLMHAAVDTRYIRGIANVAERMLILVDIESILTGDEMSLLENTF